MVDTVSVSFAAKGAGCDDVWETHAIIVRGRLWQSPTILGVSQSLAWPHEKGHQLAPKLVTPRVAAPDERREGQ